MRAITHDNSWVRRKKGSESGKTKWFLRMVLYWPISVRGMSKWAFWFSFHGFTGGLGEWVGKPFCCSFAHVYPRVAPSMYESAIRITRGQFSLLHSPPNLGHITSNCPTRLCLPFLLNLPSSFVSLSSFSHSCFTYSNTILKLNLKKISMHLVQYCSLLNHN